MDLGKFVTWSWVRFIHVLFRNFYAGLRPALVGMIFYAGLSFGTFETLREKAQARDHISFIPIKNERGEINYFVNLVILSHKSEHD